MIIAALTGSIAMGKTATARLFRERGIPVFDSDAVVHELYAKGGGAVSAIGRLAPEVVVDGAVDRRHLAAKVQVQPDLLKKIEAAVHPMVRARQQEFLTETEKSGVKIAVLDIPLLFETGRASDVDVIIVVSAGTELQRERALKREGMTPEKLDFILSKQIPDADKRARADYVIDTSASLEDAARQVDKIIDELGSSREKK